MSVIFDEVTATVESPANTTPTPEDGEPARDTGNPAEMFLQLTETRKRRAKRLWAD